MSRTWLLLAALLGGLGVAIGAFGAHWLDGAVQTWNLSPSEQQRQQEIWETAVRYQLFHALGLLAIAVLSEVRFSRRQTSLTIAGVCFVAGPIIFSGCLYALVLTGEKVLGAVVPLGGVIMILGWGALGAAAIGEKAEIR